MTESNDQPREKPIRDEEVLVGQVEGSSQSVLDHRHAEPMQVQLELEQVAPPSTGTKWFAGIGFVIVMFALLMALVLPIALVWWFVTKW